MHTDTVPTQDGASTRILVVVDWNIDPRVVVRELRARHSAESAVFNLLVPARLPALDWIGTPKASCPCAVRHLTELSDLCQFSALPVADAAVRDPEQLAGIKNALESWPAATVIMFERRHHRLFKVFSVANRVMRSTGAPVERKIVPLRQRPRVALRMLGRRRAQRCAIAGS